MACRSDDTALKIIKTTDNDLEVLFNLGNIGHNNAATHGGAIHIEGGAEVTIHSSEIGYNTALNGNGGAIYVNNSTLTIKWSNLHDNSAGNGGAIYFVNDSGDEHKLTVIGSSLRRNTATDNDGSTDAEKNGGAIYFDNGTLTDGAISSLADNSFSNQRARNGGVIYLANGKLIVDNSTIDKNFAGREGGGIYVAGGNLTVRHSTIVKNRAAVGGGIGIFAPEDGDSDDSGDSQSAQIPGADDNNRLPSVEGDSSSTAFDVVLTDDEGNSGDPEVYIYNSIIAENTDTDSENSVCLTDLLSENEGNILQDVGCVEAQSAAVPVRLELVPFDGPNLPRAVINRFYRLLEGSPAIDNGVDTPGQMLGNDQTGHARPEGEGYDSGAFEYDFEEIWIEPPAPLAPGRPSVVATPVDVSVHTCFAVSERDNGITVAATHGLTSGVQCQEIGASRHRNSVDN